MPDQPLKNHPLSWRLPRDIVPLENFDLAAAHVRSEFDSNTIWSLTAPRMAGSPFHMDPEDIRDTLRSGILTPEKEGYLLGVFKQLGVLEAKLFRHACGASLFELARAMIQVGVRHPVMAEWMNCQSPNHQLTEEHQRCWWSNHSLGASR